MSSNKKESSPEVVSIRDFHNHDLRIALLEKSVSSIDSTLKELRVELRWIIGAIGTSFTVLLGFISHGFHWI